MTTDTFGLSFCAMDLVRASPVAVGAPTTVTLYSSFIFGTMYWSNDFWNDGLVKTCNSLGGGSVAGAALPAGGGAPVCETPPPHAAKTIGNAVRTVRKRRIEDTPSTRYLTDARMT